MRMMLFVFVGFTLTSCFGSKALDEKQLREYINNEENGLKKTVAYENYTISMTYRPTDLIVKQQMNQNSQHEIDSLRKIYSKYVYFTMTIEKDGKDLETDFAMNPSQFSSMISYLSAQFGSNISLETEGGREPIKEYVYVRSYGTGPSNFLLVFDKPQESDFTILVEGHDIGFGRTTFSFNKSDIEQTPNLKF
jgi:hypothetical protein